MPIPDEVKEEIAARFRAKYIQDRAGNGIRELAAYLADLPPEHQDLIAAEYVAMRGIPLAPEPASLDSSRSSRLSEPGDDAIGPYKIIRELGRGGQATVYLAEDLRLHRQVALKVLDSGFTSNGTAFERFRREAAITSKLDHPGICTVYETGEDRGVLWIAMRYVEGESLARQIASTREGNGQDDPAAARPSPDSVTGPRTWGEVTRLLKVFEDAARALHTAHEAGVVHRDIKPGNLIVTKEGDPVILDFGLAQELDGDHPSLTVTGDMMGTPAYMSPEQLTAQRIRLDRRTDVYSLGISLYECLTLRRPFEAPTREGLYKQILTKDPPDLRSANRSISSDLKVVVQTALEKDRDRRYQTALDLAEELRRVRMREPILAKPVGQLVRLQRWAQRNPGLATSFGGLFAVLVAGLAVALFLLGQRDRALADVTTERDAKNTALTQVTTERNEKAEGKRAADESARVAKENLEEVLRLADVKRLSDLNQRADDLWPELPEKVSKMNDWLRDADKLSANLPRHRQTLNELRAQARPYDEAMRTRDRETHPDAEKLAQLEAEVEGGERADGEEEPSTEEREKKLAELDEQIERLEREVSTRRTWQFADDETLWRHDTMAGLVDGLAKLPAVIASVKDRLSRAERVEQETITDHRADWERAIASIANESECPKYHGLHIDKQIGLVPIGRDPVSGLWEFAHPRTGEIPERDANGKLVLTEKTCLVFVLLPGGTFAMGAIRQSDPNEAQDADGNESPVRQVTLAPFFLAKYEMTQGQWLAFTGKNPSYYNPTSFKSEITIPDHTLLHPVEQVSYDDCARVLSELGLVLPTEAQWEYGARAGTSTPWWTGAAKESLKGLANIADQRFQKSYRDVQGEDWDDGFTDHAPVGSYRANPFGLHDTIGNVWEWCRDWYGDYQLPVRSGDGERMVLGRSVRVPRGGSFHSTAFRARSALRRITTPEGRDADMGVRPAQGCH